MEYQEILRRRRMVRRFDDRPVADDQVDRIVHAALRAPTAGFTQGVELLVLHAPEERERFWGTNRHNPQPDEVRRGGLLVVPFASKDAYLDRYAEPDKGWTDRDEARWPVPYWYIDAGFSAMLALLQVVEESLGAVLFGIPREDWPELRETFGIPDDQEPIGAIVAGHRLPDPPSPRIHQRRRPAETRVHRGHWSTAS